MARSPLTALARTERTILVVRGQRVILDADLAELYGVPVKRLNEQVKRNRSRFPEDFMFQLTGEEMRILRSQIATLRSGWGQHRKYLPFAFTEHGAVMAANVLNSPTAIEASVFVVRAFIRLREAIAAHRQIARKLAELERKTGAHDEAIRSILAAIHGLMEPAPTQARKRIGFHPPSGGGKGPSGVLKPVSRGRRG